MRHNGDVIARDFYRVVSALESFHLSPEYLPLDPFFVPPLPASSLGAVMRKKCLRCKPPSLWSLVTAALAMNASFGWTPHPTDPSLIPFFVSRPCI